MVFDTEVKDAAGSPPRVRGKVSEALKRGKEVGITPARAGKRVGLSKPRASGWDHPRACGEKL